MRLPLTPQLSTKDGAANKNARLTNMLREKDKAVVRPGLAQVLDYAGVGQGLVPFNDSIFALFDDIIYDFGHIGDGDDPAAILASGTTGKMVDISTVSGTPVAFDYPVWNAGYTYPNGVGVSYGGDTWFSWKSGNTGNTPVQGAWWTIIWISGDWDEDEEYNRGDSVTVNGITYYSIENGNTGHPPPFNIGVNGYSTFWSTDPVVTDWKINPIHLIDFSGLTPQAALDAWVVSLGPDAHSLPIEMGVGDFLFGYYNWTGVDPNPHAGGVNIIRST